MAGMAVLGPGVFFVLIMTLEGTESPQLLLVQVWASSLQNLL